MSRNLKITMAYDGAEFHGWQVQPGFPTVQGVLAECLGRITGENVLPQGSGRTDAGVHALAQVASVRVNSPVPERNLQIALNDILPTAIRVTGGSILYPRKEHLQPLPALQRGGRAGCDNSAKGYLRPPGPNTWQATPCLPSNSNSGTSSAHRLRANGQRG